MNFTKVFFCVLVCAFFIVGCTKDEPITTNDYRIVQDDKVDLRSTSSSSCGYISELCMPCDHKHDKAPDLPVAVEDILVLRMREGGGEGEGQEYVVHALPSFVGSQEYLVYTEEGNYILTNSTSEYIASKSLEIEVPPVLLNLFDLNYELANGGEYALEQIASDLGVAVQANEYGEVIIQTSSFTTSGSGGGVVQALPIDPCQGQLMKVMQAYYKELNEPLEVYSEVLLDIWMANVDPIFNEARQEVDIYRDCIDPRVIVDGLLDDLSIAPDRKDNLKINYLGLLLNLDDDQISDLDGADDEFIDELYDLTVCGTLTFCEAEQDQNDNIENIIKSLIQINGVVTAEDFRNELDKEDFIQLHDSFKGNAKAKCAWDKIMPSENALMCSTLDNFTGDSDIDLYLYVQNVPGEQTNGFTQEIHNLNNPAYSISLRTNYVPEACPIEILKTILHEAIHAEIKRRFKVHTTAQLNQLYPVMMTYMDDEFDEHHEYMANEWFDDLLDAVKDFYPMGYTEDEYKAIAWLGLQETNAFTANSGWTEAELMDIRMVLRANCDMTCE